MARPADLLSVDDAQSQILAQFGRLDAEDVALTDGLTRVLAAPASAPIELPPFANSSMDGFALSTADARRATPTAPVRLPVSFEIPAGAQETRSLEPGTCARIMTGAPMPAGADAVIPFEEVEENAGSISLRAAVQSGACVRPAGQDISAGQQVLAAGTTLGAAQIGLLAAIGRHSISVVRRPRVAILSTGDELVAPGNRLLPGQIYNSNEPMLAAAVTEAGGMPIPLPSVRDDADRIEAAVRSAQGSDLMLTSGGASVGDFDYVKQALGASGEINFWRVRMRPGKPLIFGSIGETPLLGLPGNPTSAMATFEIFARPAIRRMLGAPTTRPIIQVVVDDTIENRGGRRTFARVALRWCGGRFHATLAGRQDSAMLLPLSAADGLLEIPESCEELVPGDAARMHVWRLPAAAE